MFYFEESCNLILLYCNLSIIYVQISIMHHLIIVKIQQLISVHRSNIIRYCAYKWYKLILPRPISITVITAPSLHRLMNSKITRSRKLSPVDFRPQDITVVLHLTFYIRTLVAYLSIYTSRMSVHRSFKPVGLWACAIREKRRTRRFRG